MLLSILICSIESRADFLARLLAILEPQTRGRADVEVLVDLDDGQITIGAKRNRLLDRSAGRWVCFIDDDDTIADDYVALLVAALSGDPDCVGFRAEWWHDGAFYGPCRYALDVPRRTETPKGDCFLIERFIGHLQPVRADLARAVGFNAAWSFGEDADYSIRLRPLLKTAAFVDAVLYNYFIRSRETRAHERVHPSRWDVSGQVRIGNDRGLALARLRGGR